MALGDRQIKIQEIRISLGDLAECQAHWQMFVLSPDGGEYSQGGVVNFSLGTKASAATKTLGEIITVGRTALLAYPNLPNRESVS